MVKRALILFGCGMLLIIVLGLLRGDSKSPRTNSSAADKTVARADSTAETARSPARRERWQRVERPTESVSPQLFVQEKVSQFGRSRRELASRLAEKHQVKLTPEIDAFFAAVETGDWERIKPAFDAIAGGDSSAGYAATRAPEVSKVWPAIIDAYGVAEQAHLWPPEALLDYGYGILDSLRPGMVYVGGTDSSRWIPALLNDTEQGDKHIVITQNGLADSAYLDYLQVQFGDQMQTLSHEESHALYDVYAADARRRYEHDQNFPDQPKQLRHNEQVKLTEDGKIDVSGRTAVFEMNERLLTRLLEKNPALRFAVGESIPLPGTYADAVPLGPLMELQAGAAENFTAERAGESLRYWQERAEQVLAQPATAESDYATRTYSHDAVASANLLAAHGFHTEAEQAYRTAAKLYPGSPEAAVSLMRLYENTGRPTEARQLLDNFLREFPRERATLQNIWGLDVPTPERPH